VNTNVLHEAIRARDEAAAEEKRLQAQIERLERHAASASPAVVELAQLKADAAAAMAAWSEADGEGKIPSSDFARQAKLENELRAHTTSVENANTAIRDLVGKREKARAVVRDATRYATVAALLAVFEQEEPRLVAEIEDTRQKLADLDTTRTAFRKSVHAQAIELNSPELHRAVERAAQRLFDAPKPNADLSVLNAKVDALLSPAKVEVAA
jgi:hypothetical protein